MDKALLTLGEAAETLSLGKTTLRKLIDRGEIRVVRIGSLVRVPAREITRWIDLAVEPPDDRSPATLLRVPRDSEGRQG